jgi:hypothetical protein
MNYLGKEIRGAPSYASFVVVPTNTTSIIGMYKNSSAFIPTINGTAMNQRYTFNSSTGPCGISEMYPAPPAGTYTITNDGPVSFFFFSGAGSLKSGGTIGTATITGADVYINVPVISEQSDYIVGITRRITGFNYPGISAIKIDNGDFITITEDGNPFKGVHASNGTLPTVNITTNGGTGDFGYAFASLNSTTTADNSGGIIAIM